MHGDKQNLYNLCWDSEVLLDSFEMIHRKYLKGFFGRRLEPPKHVKIVHHTTQGRKKIKKRAEQNRQEVIERRQ